MRPAFARNPVSILFAFSVVLVGLALLVGSARSDALPFDFSSVVVDAGIEGATEVLVGDVDGDGLNDVVTVRLSSFALHGYNGPGWIVVKFGTSGLGIGSESSTPAGLPPANATLADTNGDGALEVIAVYGAPVQIWRVQPDRSLVSVATLPVLPCQECENEDVAAGDFDGDGDVDLAVSDSWDRVNLFRNDGGDAFSYVRTILFTQGGNTPLLAGDWNGDGRMDLAYNAPGLPQYLFEGSEFLGSTITSPFTDTAYRIEVADLDGDDLDDLVTVRGVSLPQIELLRGTAGGFALSATLLNTDPETVCASVGDVDGDGLLDIVSGSRQTRNVSWYRNLGGSYAPAVMWPAGGAPRSIGWIDLDADGRKDPIVASESGVAVVGWLTGPEAFVPLSGIPTAAAPSQVEIVDFDGDGVREFAVLGTLPGVVSIHRREPGDTWTRMDVEVGAMARDLAVADLDDDGASDLVALLGSGTPRVAVRRGDGAGGFLAPIEFAVPGAITVGAADLDKDGDLDLLALAPTSGRAWPILGDGAGGFVPAPDFAVPVGARDFATFNVDDDTRTDLVTADGYAGTFSTFRGSGPGFGFEFVASHPLTGSANEIEVIEANGDGRLDLVFAGAPGAGPAVVLRVGDGDFSPPLAARAAGISLTDVRAGYFDEDGQMDLVALTAFPGESLGGGVHFLRGNGDGTFEHAGAWFTGRDPVGFAFGDVTPGDSPDILVARGDGTVLLLANQLPGVVGVPPGPGPGGSSLALRISPCPAVGPFRVELAGRPHASARVEVFSADGRRVGGVHEVVAGEDGRAAVIVPAPGRAGVYLVRAAQDGREVVKRAVALE